MGFFDKPPLYVPLQWAMYLHHSRFYTRVGSRYHLMLTDNKPACGVKNTVTPNGNPEAAPPKLDRCLRCVAISKAHRRNQKP